MTITLKIKPEAQAELTRQATVSGRDRESYAASLLEKALCVPVDAIGGSASDVVPFGKRLVDTFDMIRGLADDVDFSRDRSPGRPIDLP